MAPAKRSHPRAPSSLHGGVYRLPLHPSRLPNAQKPPPKAFDMLTALPAELAIRVLIQCDHATVLSARRVSKAYRALAEDDAVWRTLFHCQPGWRARPDKIRQLAPSSPSKSLWDGFTRLSLSPKKPVTVLRRQPTWLELYRDRYLLERDYEAGQCTPHTLHGHQNSVYTLKLVTAIDEQGLPFEMLISGSRDHTTMLWDVRKRTRLHTFADHTESVLCIAANSTMFATGSTSGDIVIRSLTAPYGLIHRFPIAHIGNTINIDMDDECLASGGKDGLVRVWDLTKWNQRATFKPDGKPVNCLRMSRGRVAVGGGSQKLLLWHFDSGKVQETESSERGIVTCISWPRNSNVLATGWATGYVMLFDAETLQATAMFTKHTGLVRSVLLDWELQRMISIGYDGHVFAWDMQRTVSPSELQLSGYMCQYRKTHMEAGLSVELNATTLFSSRKCSNAPKDTPIDVFELGARLPLRNAFC